MKYQYVSLLFARCYCMRAFIAYAPLLHACGISCASLSHMLRYCMRRISCASYRICSIIACMPLLYACRHYDTVTACLLLLLKVKYLSVITAAEAMVLVSLVIADAVTSILRLPRVIRMLFISSRIISRSIPGL